MSVATQRAAYESSKWFLAFVRWTLFGLSLGGAWLTAKIFHISFDRALTIEVLWLVCAAVGK